MLVKRKYLNFETLLQDEKAKELYENVTKELNDEHLYDFTHSERFLKNKIIDKNMDWGLPSKFIIDLENGLEKLDKEYPFETSLSSEDINHVEFITGPDGIIYGPYNNLLGFYNVYPDGPKRLVTIINLEEKDGEFFISK